MSNKSRKHSILVPVDFSHHSEVALIKACEMAQCMKLPIIVLHVVHDPGDMPGYYTTINKKNSLVRIEDLALEMFENFMKAVKKRHPKIGALRKAKTMLVVGLPVTRILQVIEKLDASMVVMGSQGRTGLDHMLLGSKAEQVVRLSPIPVTIVKAK
ncbi:universal stress protein [bacterium endosymbiont of Escarpia laminata]|nr:MAG: universal stress protein [bacterium endosymbiont of Escarpia laminata]